MKFSMRFLLLYILCSFITVIAATQYFMNQYEKLSSEQATQMVSHVMESAISHTTNKIESITNATYMFQAAGTTSGSVIDELQAFKDSNYDVTYYDLLTSRQNIKYICQTLLISDPQINGVFIVLPNNQSIGWSTGIDFDYKYKPSEDKWYQDTLELHGKTYISDISKKDFFINAHESVFFSKALYNIYTGDYLGTVLIDCNPSIFELSGINPLPSDIYISVVDGLDSNKIFYSNVDDLSKSFFSYTESNPFKINEVVEGPNLSFTVAMNPYYFKSHTNQAQVKMYMVAALIMLILTIVYYPILNSIIKPLRLITTHMHSTHLRQPINMPKYSKRSDEIGLLYNEYDSMVNALNDYIKRDYQNKLITMDAQMRALEAQIDAHFLFNTLETINSIAEIEEIENISTISTALANMFRYSIKTQSELVPLRDELNHIQNYLAIQNIRYENKFFVEYDIPEEYMEKKVLKLILQPVVENCIKHGFRHCQIVGHINISAVIKDDTLIITISDDGVGIPKDKLDNINQLLASAPQVEELGKRIYQSIGIKNINSRIQLYYGTMYGLSMTSVEGEGTVNTIIIPLKEA